MDKLGHLHKGRIVAVSVSCRKGTKKYNIRYGTLLEDFGLDCDAHAGRWHRQISLLAMESIIKMCEKGLDVRPGDFAENITTEGVPLWTLPVGTRLRLGEKALLEITQIGKKCHNRCAVYHQVGDCVMPREGIFGRVLSAGTIQPADPINIISEEMSYPKHL